MDIVKRLREAYESINHHASWSLIRSAADEIERLREELQSIADVSERWEDSLVSQINEMAHKALKGKE